MHFIYVLSDEQMGWIATVFLGVFFLAFVVQGFDWVGNKIRKYRRRKAR